MKHTHDKYTRDGRATHNNLPDKDSPRDNPEAAALASEGSESRHVPADRDAAAAGTPLLGNTELIGQHYRMLFGTENWGDAMVERLPYRSGPIARAEGSLSKRRLADPEARFYYSTMMAEVALLPLCVASDTRKRDQFNHEIAGILGLDVSVARGWILSYVVCWEQGRFPKMPSHVRILSPKGRTAKSKALGELERHIRAFISSAKRAPHCARG